MSRSGRQKMSFMGIAKINPQDLGALKELMEAGTLVPAIEKRYPFSEVPEALRYLGEGHARGKVVITVARRSS